VHSCGRLSRRKKDAAYEIKIAVPCDRWIAAEHISSGICYITHSCGFRQHLILSGDRLIARITENDRDPKAPGKWPAWRRIAIGERLNSGARVTFGLKSIQHDNSW